MRSLRMAFAVVATLALVASSGAATALAEEVQFTVLCEATQESRECEEEDSLAAETPIVAEASAVAVSTKLMGSIPVTFTCAASLLEGETVGTTEANATTRLRGKISSLGFEGCKVGAETSCSEEAVNLPYETTTNRSESQGDGQMIVWDESQAPGARVKCPSIGFDCIYEASDTAEGESAEESTDVAPFRVDGGSPGQLIAEAVELKAKTPAGGNCLGSTQASLNAEYEVTSPASLYVEMATIGYSVDPESLEFTEGQTLGLTLENLGTKSWKLDAVDVSGTYSKADPNNCIKVKIFAMNGKCEVKIKCNNAEVGSFQLGLEIQPEKSFNVFQGKMTCKK